MKSLKQTLMQRDNLTSDEADEAILEAKKNLAYLLKIGDMMAAEDICETEFGLEPDYITELL